MTQKHENQKIGYNSYGSYICECTQPRDSLGGRSFGGDPHGRPPFNPPRLDHLDAQHLTHACLYDRGINHRMYNLY